MKLRNLAVGGIVLTGALAPSAAFAQTANDPYVRTPPGQVLGETESRSTPAPAPGGGVLGAEAVRGQGSTLPVTGGDIAGLTILGLAAIAGGTVLVRRSKVTVAAGIAS